MRRILLLVLCVTEIFLPSGLMSQARLRQVFSISGPCSECHAQRLYKALKPLPGISHLAYDAGRGQLSMDLDPKRVTPSQIHRVLLDAGYDVAGRKADRNRTYESCCTAEDDTEPPVIETEEDELSPDTEEPEDKVEDYDPLDDELIELEEDEEQPDEEGKPKMN